MMGTRAISGSEAIRFKNLTMASFPSIRPSSMLISITCAPPSTWSLAISKASSYLSCFIRFKNFLEPATFVRSPTLTNLIFSSTIRGSNPESLSNPGEDFLLFLFSVLMFNWFKFLIFNDYFTLGLYFLVNS